MAIPYLKRKDTGKIISDQPKSWTGWNIPFGMGGIPPYAGGEYLQKTANGIVRCQVAWKFATRWPNSNLDNYFELISLAQQIADGEGFVFEFRDLEGWIQDVQISSVPGEMSYDTIQQLIEHERGPRSFYTLTTVLTKRGYIP